MTADRIFYPAAIGASAAGTIFGAALGLQGAAYFAAGMGPLALVMLVCILREPRGGTPQPGGSAAASRGT